MRYIPDAVGRFGGRAIMHLRAKSPTILVVSGVVGLGATAVMAAKATRRLDPILDDHAKGRIGIEEQGLAGKAEQRALLDLYVDTSISLTKLYGPTVFVGAASAVSILGGHRVLVGRHVASMAAYSGLFQEFQNYRARVSESLGEDRERALYEGSRLSWQEDPDHKGEYSLLPTPGDITSSEWRACFDAQNPNWTKNPHTNHMFLDGVQSHMNRLLRFRGHLFLNEVYENLGMPKTSAGQVSGWIYGSENGDSHIDFGHMTSKTPQAEAFRRGDEPSIWLDFNVDGLIWNLI